LFVHGVDISREKKTEKHRHVLSRCLRFVHLITLKQSFFLFIFFLFTIHRSAKENNSFGLCGGFEK
jgi:hypothetical protein